MRDPKVLPAAGKPWLVYVSDGENLQRVERELASALSAEILRQIEIRKLPSEPAAIQDHGLLFLPGV